MAQTINGYVELASPQILDDRWRELNFEVTSGHNILQDLVVPESGGGYVYKDAKSLNSPVHNRVLYWRTVDDQLEFVELSTEVVLDGNQVRIRFANSPIINKITVIEFSDSIVIMIATLTSVHRLHLPHPKTTNKSILNELTTDVLYNPANYYILNNHSQNSEQPICAASWEDRSMLKCALSFPNSSILIVQFGINHHHISVNEIKQIGIIGRLWSRMPNLLTKNNDYCDNAIYFCLPYHQPETQDVILFTLCRDWKIRLFSTNTRECICTHSMNLQNSFSQSISYNNAATEQPIMKMLDSQVVIYMTESRPEFVFLDYSYKDGAHILVENSTCQTPNNWEKLLDFIVSQQKIWALAYSGEAQPVLYYLERNIINQTSDSDVEEIEGIWDFVTLVEDVDMPNIKNYVAEIFWRNHFSINTVQKALAGIIGSSIPKKTSFAALEELANTSIVDDNQEEAWARFYNYCLQNHQASNKNVGLFVGHDESVIGLVKRSNLSFICPWLTSADMLLQGGPYRGIELSTNYRAIIESLNYICTYWIDDDHNNLLEQKLFENPSNVLNSISDVIKSQLNTRKVDVTKLNIQNNLTNVVTAGIDSICDQLDLTKQAEKYVLKILQNSSSKSFLSSHKPLGSNCGITITFELFKRLVRARMNLCRDLLIYMELIKLLNESGKLTEKPAVDSCSHLNLRRLLDSYRSYAILVWITETTIKTSTCQDNIAIINYISKYFKFFQKASNSNEKSQDSSLELVLRQNLFMNFLLNGGVNYSNSNNSKTVSNSFYITDTALNFCKLLWPKSNYLCFAEFLFTHQLDDHLAKYLSLTEKWLEIAEYDRHFIKAANCLLQKRGPNSVEIFDKLWVNMKSTNLIGRFIELDKEEESNLDEINSALIYRYYDKLIQLFQINEDHQSLVNLINYCMALIGNADKEQHQWLNCLRAKLFQYYLELEEPDEAYHTMVLTTDKSLRTNCLRKFIVHHCEKQQWLNLLSYPYMDIMNDFIEILTQKAESFDLSQINEQDFYKTTFYDLLFASYVSDDEFARAADVMYNYAQRLAHEVPGLISIKKQADCLLIALNALRCADPREAFIEIGSTNITEEVRTSVLKRSHDSDAEFSTKCSINEQNDIRPISQNSNKIYCKDIEMKYELTRARLKLLEKDPTGNAIALSPLKAEETIHQLVKSSMFSAAVDLALLMKSSMEPILEGLTEKYIFLMGATINVDLISEIEQELTDIFTYSYRNIDTYNYIANSTNSIVEKIWRLILHYLTTYDGISHTYSNEAFKGTFSSSTILMKVVATKILEAGYNIPASLKRMYMARNVSELLRLLMKYDELVEASDLVVEIIERVLEPVNTFAFTSPFTTNEPPPIYLPTHLILLLITFLEEDATNTDRLKIAGGLVEKLKKYRRFVKSTS